MNALTVAAIALLLAGCAQPTQRVHVAPAAAVVDAPSAVRAGNPLVGGVALPVNRTIAADVAAAPNLSMLARAMRTAGVLDTLAGAGPVTLFAPTDEAFGRLAPGTADALLKPENGASLRKLLGLHVVPGRLSSADLVRRVAAGGGRAMLTSSEGETLTLSVTGNIVTVSDSGGNKSYVETADVRAANGVMHVVNGVLVPRLK